MSSKGENAKKAKKRACKKYGAKGEVEGRI
jgi:hypothetical protein